MDTLIIKGQRLTIENVVEVARRGRKVQLHADTIARIQKCRGLLERKIQQGETMYGVNTGIGELASVALTPEQTQQFQKYLIYNHAAGIGDPAPIEHIRAANPRRRFGNGRNLGQGRVQTVHFPVAGGERTDRCHFSSPKDAALQ